LSYLSQQDEPSAGCAQHAPPLSSGFSLGVQHTDSLFFGAQQEDAAGVCPFTSGIVLFFRSGISARVSIMSSFLFTYKDG
jgi:hypothetical protein